MEIYRARGQIYDLRYRLFFASDAPRSLGPKTGLPECDKLIKRLKFTLETLYHDLVDVK
jgi:hypothetical protein